MMSHNVVGVDMRAQRQALRTLFIDVAKFSHYEAQELVNDFEDCEVLAIGRLAVLNFNEGREQGYNKGFDDALDTYNRY
jgi:hypothetical protein